MKRIIVVFLLAMLLLSAAGCQGTTPEFQAPDYTEAQITNGIDYTDYPGVTVGINGLFFREGRTELSVVWANNTDYPVSYGANYVIQRKEGEKWVSCAKQEELNFITIGYTLEAGRLQNRDYDLTEMFDVSKPGTYRFKSSCTVTLSDGTTTTCVVWAEFTLTGGKPHTHSLAQEPQTVDDPYSGYCGNTVTTVKEGDWSCRFMYENSVKLTDLLLNLDYRPEKTCVCPGEYTVDTEFGSDYVVDLSKGFVRCEKGQADLTQEQVEQIKEIVHWAKTTNGQYPTDDE